MTTSKQSESAVCRALRPFGTSIFTEMSALAAEHSAVNLSQGFPDFDGPQEMRRAAAEAIVRGPNQYVPSMGVLALREAVADKTKRFYGVDVDPVSEVTITAGASEALSASLLGILEPGDEVILLEPCYDLYPPIIALARAKPVFVRLEKPDFALAVEPLERAFSSRTKAIVINNPQNPCGKVFTREELELVGRLCEKHDVFAIGDEVYEHLTFEGHGHVTLLDVPSLRDRAIAISSNAKTFSMTGWKVGWAAACPRLSDAVRMSHQFLTFCTPGALQEAVALAIGMDDSYYDQLLTDYTGWRSKLCRALEELGLDVLWPAGTYYCTVDISGLGLGDDVEFCRMLTTEVGVAAIPFSPFYDTRSGGKDLVRFCFCKRDETLDEAIRRLHQWRG
ncbi:MAG: aminotransferase class I/II-fold pyridoxal phosphate-dependent enzyme [Deltaproteobacteria bacterium]|nr:aminotransferase class I/II-fold pyridoxal phosphate-dependent enzyme [Deltaproteobacteria bacterium]